jgi:hypothetical protein
VPEWYRKISCSVYQAADDGNYLMGQLLRLSPARKGISTCPKGILPVAATSGRMSTTLLDPPLGVLAPPGATCALLLGGGRFALTRLALDIPIC